MSTQNVGTEKLSITIPVSMATMIRQKVSSGSYTSNSEIIREALRLWQSEESLREQKQAALEAKIQQSLDDPRPSIPAEDVFAKIRKRGLAE